MSVCRLQIFVVAVLVSILSLSAEGRFLVNQYGQHEQTFPVVAMNDSGQFVVVWRSHVNDGRSGGVYARRYGADGAPVSDEFKVNTTDVDVADWTSAVAMNGSGGFVVAWVAAREDDTNVVARMFDSQGCSLTDEMPVSLSPNAAQSSPAISMNASGSFVIVWTGWYGDAIRGRNYVSGRVFHSDGCPATDEFQVWGRAEEEWPAVAMDDSGQFVVSWIRMGNTYYRPYGEYVMYRRFQADGRAIGDAVSVTDDLNSRWYGPGIAGDQTGGFVLTWAVGPFPFSIMTQGFDSSGAATTQPCIISTCDQGSHGRPVIAGDGGGNFVVTWDNQCADGKRCGVSSRRCACNGEPVGQEVAVCDPQPERQWYAKVAMAHDGRYVVVWTGQTDDGSYDVYGQIGSL
jgi:hypothetical protein